MEEFHDVKSVLRAGTEVFVSSDSAVLSDVMTSEVIAVGDKEFAMAIPSRDGYFHPLKKGRKLDICLYEGRGKYQFDTTVCGRVIFDGVPVLKCNLPKMMFRKERRQYYRLDTFFPVKVIVTATVINDEEKMVNKAEYKVDCVDISGGGLQIEPKYNDLLPIKFRDEFEVDFGKIFVGVTVVGVTAIREPTKVAGWGLEFTKISISDRDKIMKYVFNKQLGEKKRTQRHHK